MPYSKDARVVLTHQRVLREVRDRVSSYAQSQWKGLGSWRDSDIDRFVALIVPVVESGQKQTAQLTRNYLDSMARLAGHPPVRAGLVTPKDLRGVPTSDVYRRPAQEMWWRLGNGESLTDSVAAGAARVADLVDMDMKMAMVRAASDTITKEPRVVGWQRVLGMGENCPLCAIASTQRYNTEDLMPIHERCGCDVAPIYGERDPGQVINAERLAEVQDSLAEQGVEYTGGAFKTDRSITVNVHGEYGPVLGWADQMFTGPNDIS